MFKLLDRYVIREMTIPFVIALVVSTFVMEVPIILKQGEDLLEKGVESTVIARALVNLLPAALSITIPISLLLGILIGFGRLSADREFVAMQACGVTLMRLLRPVAFVSILAAGATAYEAIVALPDGNQTFREITYNIGASRVERSVKAGIFFEDLPNLVIYVRELPAEGGWRDVFLADTRTPGRKSVYFAKEGRIRLDRERQIVQLELADVSSLTTQAANPNDYEETSTEHFTVTLDPKLVFKDPLPRGDREMTLAELSANVEREAKRYPEMLARAPTGLPPPPDPTLPYRFMYHYKLSLPWTCPILALIGLALGASNRRDGKLASFVLGFAVIFIYYALMFIFRAAALGGRFSPEWSTWMPNIIMATVGVALLVWRARSADQPIRLSMPAFWRRRAIPAASGVTAAAPGAADPNRIVLVIRIPHFRVPMPRLLDMYVAKEYWRVVLLAFVSLLGIFYISTFIDLAEKLFRGSATAGMLARYFYFQTPQFVFFVLPMAVLVGTLVTIAIMTKNSELIVMRACGISLYRTALPLVVFGILIGGTLFAMQEYMLPAANKETDRLNRLIRGLAPQRSPFNEGWIVNRSGDFYHYELFNPHANRFMNLWVYDVSRDDWRLNALTYAKDATLVHESGPDEQSLMTWTARHGWTREVASRVRYEPFTERQLAIEPPDYFANKPHDTDQMSYDEMLTYGELREYIEQRRASGADVVPYLVALRRKIAFPFVTVIMTLLAIPFAAATGRRGALYGIGAAIVLAISYFLTMSIFGALGSGGSISPMIAAWAPNVLFSVIAVYLVLTVRT